MGVENAMKLEFCFGRNPRLLFYNLGQADQLIVQIKESIEALNKSLDDNKEVYSNEFKEKSKNIESSSSRDCDNHLHNFYGKALSISILQDLQYAMRRAGQNPTDVEVQDLINKIDDGSGTLDFTDFCLVIKEKTKELDSETHFKDTFRVFSKDEEGEEMLEELNDEKNISVQDVFQQMR